MMRRFLMLSAALLAVPAFADTLTPAVPVAAVTVYGYGADVVRVGVIQGPEGRHEVIVAGLPADLDPSTLRIGAEGLVIVSRRVEADPQTRAPEAMPAAWRDARAERDALRTRDGELQAEVDRLAADITAAEARLGFLQGLKGTEVAATPDAAAQLPALLAAIGDQAAAAGQAVLEARAALRATEQARTDLAPALVAAEDRLAALPQPQSGGQRLVLEVVKQGAADATLRLEHFVQEAGWQPQYDLNLTRGPDLLHIDRLVGLTQNSGEDWRDVTLTVTTADPSRQARPSDVWPDLRRIEEPEAARAMAKAAPGMMADEAMVAAEAPAPVVTMGAGQFDGFALTWAFPEPVTVPAGAPVQLALDARDLPVRLEARAVPLYDTTAYLLAHLVNEGDAPMLPGPARILREGKLVTQIDLAAIAAGDKAEIGFGPIDGLILTREMPQRAEGERGFFTSSTEASEEVLIRVENLTAEAWPVRLIDRVPYSEQEALETQFTANPVPTVTDLEGQRGVLAWDFTLAARATKEITLTHSLKWPEGMELR